VKSKQALYLLITGLFLLIIGHTYSQNVFQKTYGGTSGDYSESIRYLSDGGFVISGTTASYGTGGAEARDLFIGRYNLIGVNAWSAEAGTNNKRQESQFVIPLSDGGFVPGGRTNEALDGNDSWIFKKYSSAGAVIAERILGKTSTNAAGGGSWDDEMFAAMETPFANIVAMVGFTMNYRTPNEKEITFITYDFSTNAINLTRHFGRPSIDGGATDDKGKDICEDAAGQYTLFGESAPSVAQGRDFIAIHLTPLVYNLGTYRTFGGTGSEEALSITKCADGGYLMVGYTNSPGVAGGDDWLVIKTDVNFNLTWARMIGGASEDRAFEAAQTSDGGFIIVGHTFSYGFGNQDMMVVKLTSTGNLSWAKCYGGTGGDGGRSVSKRPDGGFYFSGFCGEPISPAGNGQDIYVVATNSLGYSGGCNEMSITPTFNNSPTINTNSAGLTQAPGDPQIENIVYPMTNSVGAPVMTCKCENIAPNREITGSVQVCHNSSGNYYINKVPGYTNYTWSITGGSFSPAPAATDTSVTVNFTTTNVQIIVSTAGTGCNDFVIDTIDIAVDNITTNITTADSSLCIGDNTNLTAVTVNNVGAVTSWVWNPVAPNNATVNVSPGSTTTYSVTVTDALGCSDGDTIRVNVYTYPVVNIGPNDTVCNGGPVLLNATTAGSTYLWSTSAATATINAATSGTYWVDVTRNGCTTRDSIILGISTNPTVTITGDDSLCIGQSTVLTANPAGGSGGYTFLWAGGLGTANTINPTPASSTTYTVTVTEAYGCTGSATRLVNVFSYPVVNIGPNDTVCNGGPVLLNATTPTATYLWNTSASTATINAATSGTYWVDVTTNGCTTRDSIILGISTNPTATITGDDSLCIGQSTVLTANPAGGSGGYTFLWASGLGSGNTINPSPGVTTTYTVTVTEAYGCTITATKLVNVFSYPTVDLGPDSNICNGVVPFVTLDAQNPGASYAWSTSANTQTINVNSTGTYWADVNINGCVTRDSVQVNFSTNPTAGYTGITAICVGSSTTMYGNGSGGTPPLTYTWSQGPTVADSILLSPPITTNYNVIASDVAGCKDTAYFTITVNPYPVVDLGPDTVGCTTSPITLNAPVTSGTTLWSTGATSSSVSVPTADTVWVEITENGCTTRDSAVVDYYPLPSVNLGPDTIICAVQNLLLDATNVYSTYVWSDASTSATLTVAQTNLYWVDVTSCGITVSDSIMIYMDTFSVYVVNMVPNDCGSNNGSLTVGSNSTYATTYLWSGAGAGSNPALTNISDGTYIITATDSLGCFQTDTITIICNIPSIVVTQLVTPNADGKNDTWIIQGINNFTSAVVTVYNRWGNEVYRSVPYNNDWDGKSNSSISLGNDYLPAGTYFYVVDLYGDGSDVKSGYLEFQP
jgi:gliding motility-associated-like protein